MKPILIFFCGLLFSGCGQNKDSMETEIKNTTVKEVAVTDSLNRLCKERGHVWKEYQPAYFVAVNEKLAADVIDRADETVRITRQWKNTKYFFCQRCGKTKEPQPRITEKVIWKRKH